MKATREDETEQPEEAAWTPEHHEQVRERIASIEQIQQAWAALGPMNILIRDQIQDYMEPSLETGSVGLPLDFAVDEFLRDFLIKLRLDRDRLNRLIELAENI